jgi:hypothetical protein
LFINTKKDKQMGFITSFFSNTKNIIMFALGIFGVGYIATQKYKAAKAESQLQEVETKIAKTNVIVAKTKAKAKAEGKKAETDAHIEVLKELKKESKEIQKEMGIIAGDIKKATKSKQKFKVEV